jgi:hypothetical protein
MNEYVILLIWDDEAHVWIAQNDEIPTACVGAEYAEG